jgi:hypothetical protein
MKKIAITGALAGIIYVVTVPSPAAAQAVGKYERYCAVGAGAMRCEWATMAQCKATFNTGGASGANCMLNPRLAKRRPRYY